MSDQLQMKKRTSIANRSYEEIKTFAARPYCSFCRRIIHDAYKVVEEHTECLSCYNWIEALKQEFEDKENLAWK